MNEERYYILKSKSLLGNLTEEEQSELASLDREDQYALEGKLDNLTKGSADASEMEDKVLSKIGKKRSLDLNWIWTVAASMLLIGGLWNAFLRINSKKEFQSFANNSATVKEIVLQDNSIVTLNKAAVLVVKSDFSGIRKVYLKGEAMFKVTHDGKRPFVVMGDCGDVKVLGTTFVVDNNEAQLEATLVEGSIALQVGEKQQLIKPNQQVVVNNSGKMVVSNVNVVLRTSWSEGKIRFHEERLSSVVKRIATEKGVEIMVKESRLRDRRISGVFNVTDSVESMLYALTKVTKTNYKKEGEMFVIE